MLDFFNSHCTIPPDSAGLVSVPDARGTLSIVWSCLAVVSLCTWAVLHECVPVEGDSKEPFLLAIYLFLCKTSSFLIAFFAPELFAGKAMGSLYFAREGAKEMQKCAGVIGKGSAPRSKVGWSLRHAFLANMGGWAIDFDPEPEPSNADPFLDVNPKPVTTPSTFPSPDPAQQLHDVEVRSSPGINKAVNTFRSDEHESPTPSAQPKTPPSTTSLLFEAKAPLLTQSPPPSAKDSESETERHMGVRNPEHRQPEHPDRRANEITSKEEPVDPKTTALRKRLACLRKEYQEERWFIFPIPKFAKGNWDKVDNHQDRIDQALRTATESNLGPQSIKTYFDNIMALRGNIWVVDGAQLRCAYERGIIAELPQVTEAEIMDKSKGDWITKLFAIVQVLWLWTQVGRRLALGLAVTQLEVMTVAFAACSAITYAMYWCKPKDVSSRFHIKAAQPPTYEDMIEMAQKGPSSIYFRRVPLSIGNDCFHNVEKDHVVPYTLMALTTAVFGVVFAAVHFLCWNWDFPSELERQFWRISCVILVVYPLPMAVLMLGHWQAKTKSPTDYYGGAFSGARRVLEGTYIVARLFIVVEACRSLWYQPGDAFLATPGLNSVPHIA